MSEVRRGWSRTRVSALLLALLSVGVMAAALRVSEDSASYQIVQGVSDQTVDIRAGKLSVGSVRVGTRLLEDGTISSETPGLFVVVEVRLAATANRDIYLNSAQLLTGDGWTYARYVSSSVLAVSGFRTISDLVFEVDPAHLDDLTIQLWESEIVAGYQQRTRIHLGITPANADQWARAGRDAEVEPRPVATTEALG